MTKYLYGAAVQGIQDFIFETNKLREIVGASEFVEAVCTELFKEVIGVAAFSRGTLIQGAAGNIRFLFANKEDCESGVRNFPFRVLSQAPGIQVSQAIVEVEGGLTTAHISILIEKLDRQRNTPQRTFLAAPMAAQRSRTTGHAAVKGTKDHLSTHQALKEEYNQRNSLKKKLGAENHIWTLGNLDDLVKNDKGTDEWLAIVHADGNNLGRLIMNVVGQLKNTNDEAQNFFQHFSEALDTATTSAAKTAYQNVFKSQIAQGVLIPFRPVLLGGDDLTVIIKARYAMEFTRQFIEKFEEESKNLIYPLLIRYKAMSVFENGLTTCAGIAFIKPNYPFHYGVHLADSLCKAAKGVSKKINQECSPSSLMFHQVHSSFIGEWNDIIERELTVASKSNQQADREAVKKRFDYGPYFLHKQNDTSYATIAQLQQWKATINESDAPKSQLRALVTEYTDNPAGAEQYEHRMRLLDAEKQRAFFRKLQLGDTIFQSREKEKDLFSAAWDIIKLSTIETEKT